MAAQRRVDAAAAAGTGSGPEEVVVGSDRVVAQSAWVLSRYLRRWKQKHVVVTPDEVLVYESPKDTAEPVYRIPCAEIARVATSPGDPLQIVLTLHNATTYNIRFGLREHATDWARLVASRSLKKTK